MPDLGDILNVGDPIPYKGKSYTARDLTLEQRGRFGKWLKDRAKADIIRDQESGDYADAWVRLRLSTFEQDEAAGLYDWGSPASLNAIRCTVVGGAYALYLMFQDAHPDMTEDLAREVYDDLLKRQAKEEARRLAAKMLDPPASSAPGAPSQPGPSASPGSPTADTPGTPSAG